MEREDRESCVYPQHFPKSLGTERRGRLISLMMSQTSGGREREREKSGGGQHDCLNKHVRTPGLLGVLSRKAFSLETALSRDTAGSRQLSWVFNV